MSKFGDWFKGQVSSGNYGTNQDYNGKSIAIKYADENMHKAAMKKKLAKGSGDVPSNKPDAKPPGDAGGGGGGAPSADAMQAGGEALSGLAGKNSDAGGALGGAGSGAAMGMKLGGPKGAVVGAVAGAAMGMLQAKENRAKAKAMGRVEASKERAQAEAGKRAARTKMAEAIGTTLRSGKQSVSL